MDLPWLDAHDPDPRVLDTEIVPDLSRSKFAGRVGYGAWERAQSGANGGRVDDHSALLRGDATECPSNQKIPFDDAFERLPRFFDIELVNCSGTGNYASVAGEYVDEAKLFGDGVKGLVDLLLVCNVCRLHDHLELGEVGLELVCSIFEGPWAATDDGDLL